MLTVSLIYPMGLSISLKWLGTQEITNFCHDRQLFSHLKSKLLKWNHSVFSRVEIHVNFLHVLFADGSVSEINLCFVNITCNSMFQKSNHVNENVRVKSENTN
jgi:prepilin-type processing-associated H-X9-DG protein